MKHKPFVVYRSSAGSGKTYTLAKEYLLLALKRPNYFKHILAVTFTNKATAEMKGRIVEYLSNFSEGKENEMSAELMQKSGMQKDAFQKQCSDVLSMILHNYSQFSVSTIDAFFQKVIRSFAKEVGLHGGFQLELDQVQVLNQVIDDVIEDIGKDELLTHWLVNFAEAKVAEGKSWDMKYDLLRFAKELFTEAYKGNEPILFQVASDKLLFKKFLDELTNKLTHFETSCQKFADHAFRIMDEYGLTMVDFARKAQGPAGYFQKLLEPPYDVMKLGLNSYQLPALDTIEAWHTKTSDNKEIIAKAVEDKLMQHYNDTISFVERELVEYCTTLVVRKNIYAFGVLLNVASKLQQYKEKEGVMLISDANSFLKKIVEDNDTPFVYEKTGSFFKNYLIDEFQDTSNFQWQNFTPLVSNSLAEGNRNLVVGDVKQSIYRWRGGDWQLLQHKVENEIGADYTQTENLDKNFRSAKQLINVNNLLFSDGANRLSQLFESKLELDGEGSTYFKQQAALIQQAYGDVEQLFPASNEREGYLSFSFLKKTNEEGVGWKDVVLERIPLILENLQDRGVAISDVAFLVRGSKDAKLVADYLIDYKNSTQAKPGYSYNIVSNESLMLHSAMSVQLLIHALQYLSNSSDQIALANLVYHYQCSLGNDQSPDKIFNGTSLQEFLPPGFSSEAANFKKLSLVDLLEVLIRMFGLDKQQGEYIYIHSFQDVILEYSGKYTADIYTFLQWWDENSSKQFVKLPENTDASRIMTIHKSKGLQFKAVVIPFCNWKIDHETGAGKETRMWLKSDNPPYNAIPFLPINYSAVLKHSHFSTAYYHEMLQAYMDNFNLLYVALTRAEDYLFTFSEEPGKSISKVSDIMYEVLKSNREQLNGSWNEEAGIFRFGKWDEQGNVNRSKNEEIPFQYISNSWQQKLSIKYNSQEFFKTTPDKSQSSVNYGNLVHELMARIITPDQLSEVLDNMKYEGLITEENKIDLSNTVLKMFENKQVLSWYDRSWIVKTEVPVLPKTGEMSRMDRVMINGNKAVVVDYKTGFPKQKDVVQVESYKHLLNKMGFEIVDGYLLYVDKVEIVEV